LHLPFVQKEQAAFFILKTTEKSVFVAKKGNKNKKL